MWRESFNGLSPTKKRILRIGLNLINLQYEKKSKIFTLLIEEQIRKLFIFFLSKDAFLTKMHLEVFPKIYFKRECDFLFVVVYKKKNLILKIYVT